MCDQKLTWTALAPKKNKWDEVPGFGECSTLRYRIYALDGGRFIATERNGESAPERVITPQPVSGKDAWQASVNSHKRLHPASPR